jgi:hypothetical protein
LRLWPKGSPRRNLLGAKQCYRVPI